MIKKFRIGRWRFTFTFAPVVDVIGVNSVLPDGSHILMWDFDDVDLETVKWSLAWVQWRYNLPAIYILQSSENEHYIAYCFKKVSWRKAIEIIASTPNIDLNFFKYGVYREKFTLRVTPKADKKPRLVCILDSQVLPDASIEDLKSWVKYETLAPEAEGS
jgi:hypothetical protein